MIDQPRSLAAWVPHLWRTVLFPGPAATDLRAAFWPALLTLVLPAVLLYPCRDFHLFEPDESRYAQIPKEMRAADEWVVPTLQGQPYLDKPPLMYWLVRLSYGAFGVTPEAARLVPAVCVHLTILLVYWLGKRSIGSGAAGWAAVLLTVSPLYIGVARLLLLDGLLTLCVTASVLCGFEAVRTGRLLRGWWLLSALASGLGFLTKGPISEVLLFPPLLAFAYLNGATARVGCKMLLAFGAVVAGVNLPWYVAVYNREPEFLKHFFWDHNVMRFLQPFDHLQPVWYYAPILLGGLLPTTVLAIPLFRGLIFGRGAETRSQAGGFWLLAGLWCAAFFSVSGSKLPTYILPAFPFLCLAAGEFVARSGFGKSAAWKAVVAGFYGLMVALHYVGVPWYAAQRSPVGNPEKVVPYLEDPAVPVITYPRNCDSVAYYLGRSDFDQVRSKDVNDLMVAMHHRPRTVILFTHGHSFEAFRDALPPSLEVAESSSLSRPGSGWRVIDALAGKTPWGLTDVAVIRPAGVARAAGP